MRRIIFRISILFILLTTTCFAFENEIQERDRLHDEVLLLTKKEIEKKFPLKINSFGGSTLDGVRSFSLGFSIDRTLSIDEARCMIVECEEIFLRNINAYKAIRPFLVEYPFPVDRTSIGISSPSNKENSSSLDHVFISKNRILYYSRTNGELFREPYEEAKKEVYKEHKSSTVETKA